MSFSLHILNLLRVGLLTRAQGSDSCTVQSISVGKATINGSDSANIDDLVTEAFENADPLRSFPVFSSNECWSACLQLAQDDKCNSWAVYLLPFSVNGKPFMQCRLYEDAASIGLLSETSTVSQIPKYSDVIVEYGEVGGSFGLELDCNEDLSDPVCLGTSAEVCGAIMPYSPISFNSECSSNDSCVVGCCAIRTPTIDGTVQSNFELSLIYPEAKCYELLSISDVRYSEECVSQCRNNQECTFSVYDTVRGGKSLGNSLASACRLISCLSNELPVDAQAKISSYYVSPLALKPQNISRYLNIYIPDLTNEAAIVGSNGRKLPDQMRLTVSTSSTPPTSSSATVLTTVAAVTTVTTTTTAQCIFPQSDSSSKDLTVIRGITSVNNCQLECRNNSLCDSWVWVAGDFVCYLKYGPVDIFPITNTVMIFAGFPFCDGDDTTVERPLYRGVVIDKEPLAKQTYDISTGIWTASFPECLSLCEIHPVCQTWTYTSANQLCYLKTFTNSLTTVDQIELQTTVGVFSGGTKLDEPFLTPELLEPVPQECLDAGANYEGNDLYQFWSPHPIECSYKCREDYQCRFFTYDAIRNICFLKFAQNRQILAYNSTQRLISGSRDCPQSETLPSACVETVAKPDPPAACEVYKAFFTPDKSNWVDYMPSRTVQISNINTWWRKENTNIDFSNPGIWSRAGFGFVAPSLDNTNGGLCNLSDFTPEEESCWDRAMDYFPFVLEAEVVAVAPRSTFSGFGRTPESRPDTEWAIFEPVVIDLSNPAAHHGFHFNYSRPEHWPKDGTTPNNFEMSTVHIMLKLRDIKGSSPVRPTELYVLFCIWGEPQPEIMEEQPDKHTEICAPPLVLVPTNPNSSVYTTANMLEAP